MNVAWRLLVVACAAVAMSGAWAEAPPTRFTPDVRVNPDDVTVLSAADGRNPNGLAAWIDDHRRLQVKNWPLGGETIWEVEAAEAGDYAVNVLFHHGVDRDLTVTVAAGASHVTGVSHRIPHHDWRRFSLPGTLAIGPGRQTVALRIAAQDGAAGTIELLAIELVKPGVRERLHRAALDMRSRADTEWFRQAGFGLMLHWTSQSMPRRGAPKPYAEAVRDFDVETFADQVAATGAGFVTLTTSHAAMYFPGPLEALDRILPGRTAGRDLVADIAEALAKRSIRLMLYYNAGSSSDPAWQRASGFWETDTSRFWNNWTAVVTEVGERYRDRLAGWWFDDGTATYHHRSPPWERLATAAKAGNSKRIICFNPWILPPATEFQDFLAGEGAGDPTVGGWLKPADRGRISGGAYEGLQASAAIIMETDWLHGKRDSDISAPRMTTEQLADLLRRFRAVGNVVMLNCEIYQDGTLSPATVDVIREANGKSRDAAADTARREPQVLATVDVAPAWAGHPVGFALLTRGRRQYVAFYAADRHLTVGARSLDGTTWEFFRLPSMQNEPPRGSKQTSAVVGWDSHNGIVMAADSAGHLHLAGNMHCNGLTYWRTREPAAISSFEQVAAMVGREEDTCTYPAFLTLADGRLVFQYRAGRSGDGSTLFNIYDVAARSWRRLVDGHVFDGEGKRNAYPLAPVLGPDGMYHVSWVWRESPDAATNHDLSYARTRDFVHWEDAAGRALALPIRLGTEGVIVDPVPVGGGILNGTGHVGFDGQGRPVLAYYKYDPAGMSQAFVARWEGGSWRIVKLTDWQHRFEVSGLGSLPRAEIHLGAPQPRAATAELSLEFGHAKERSGTLILDGESLAVVRREPTPPRYPRSLFKVESTFPGMSVRITTDSGPAGEPGRRFILRWETLGANRDQPRPEPWPEPSMLRVIEVRGE